MAGILLLEDQFVTATLITTVLRGLGHSVVWHKDGRAGLKAFTENRPDLVITDIFMPDMDGIEVIRAIRTGHPSFPIIAISGGGSFNNLQALDVARQLGANNVIRKPVTREQLLAAVETCLLMSDGQGGHS